MQSKRLAAMILATLIVLLFVLSACSSPAVEASSRQMVALTRSGQPEILRNGEANWQILEHKTIIQPGDIIRTGEDTWVYLEINDGSLVGITPNTQASLVTFSTSLQDPITLFDLADGLIYVRVTKELGGGSFKVHTPVMTGSIVGSKMAVQYISSLNTADITCFEGNVNAEIDYNPQESPLSCHLISGVKISTSTKDEWTVKKCQNPAPVQRYELDAYSDWEEMYIDLEFMRQTEAARNQTLTKVARYTKTPTPTEAVEPNQTPLPSSTPTITATPAPVLRPTITVDPDAPLSSAEQANSGTHNYTYTASYSGNCSGPASGEINQMQIRFEGNQVILASGNQQSQFAKVDENTYQASDGVDIVTMTFTEDGFTGESQCVFWTYTRR
ncbi:hypothetical protein ADN00_13450 [Ornatilinea apprima]|uniref:FecR protein domain-containing protein n=1 Tax=Ornatilinea apprima TaxID=1134406 RepID=A0A0P6X4K7_9CHLR|nr:FecR family protein [Ornatilinea apprima]KPL74838.1 hypothetical protein ADN00_13450 [Ornatilinea apprima]